MYDTGAKVTGTVKPSQERHRISRPGVRNRNGAVGEGERRRQEAVHHHDVTSHQDLAVGAPHGRWLNLVVPGAKPDVQAQTSADRITRIRFNGFECVRSTAVNRESGGVWRNTCVIRYRRSAATGRAQTQDSQSTPRTNCTGFHL